MIPQIQEAREMAITILKPSSKELEHGLKLHADAVVCEAYGFVPRCAVDGTAIRRELEAGASLGERFDLVEEMSMTRCVHDKAERAEYIAALNAAGVTCIFLCAGREGQSIPWLLRRLAHYTYVVDNLPEIFQRAVRPDDILSAKAGNTKCLYLTCNGVPLPGEWRSVAEELAYIRIFFQLGCRMMHLTYNRRNMIGDGCGETANGGLSDFGRAVVAEMNRVGVIVDVAHSGWRTSLEAAKASKYPVVASHSCCCTLNRHIRGKPDEVIRAIADAGGYIGICAIPQFLGKSGDLNAMLDHIDYVAKTFGAEHVAIGMDTGYCSSNYEAEIKKLPPLPKTRDGWEHLWPENSLPYIPEWRKPEMLLSLAWTNWPLITVGLVKRGYNDDDIRKIIGGNVLRVAREVIKAPTLVC